MADKEDQNERGSTIPAALAGAAIYEGLPIVTSQVLNDVPHSLATMAMTGRPIQEAFGTPLSQIAEFSRGEARAIRDFAASRGVSVPIVAAGADVGLNSGYFMDRTGPVQRVIDDILGRKDGDVAPHIALSRSSVPHALHEVGHASPILGSDTLRKALQGLGRNFGQGSSLGNVLRAALASSVLSPPDENTSPTRQFLYDHAPTLVGATMLPELLEEGRASLKALQGSREYGPGMLRTLAELAPALGTYVASAAAPVLATILAKHVVAALRNSAKPAEEKTAAQGDAVSVKTPGILKATAASAWKVGMNPPKPKTIGPAQHLGAEAMGRAPAKPPSKTSFYNDLLSTLYNPQRGSRLAVG